MVGIKLGVTENTKNENLGFFFANRGTHWVPNPLLTVALTPSPRGENS